MLTDAWAGRHIVAQLARRDLLLRSESSMLGLAWSLAQPLLWLVLFSYLHRSRVFSTAGLSVPYPVFAFVGLIHWHLFAGIIIGGGRSLVAAKSLIAKVHFPREALVLAAAIDAVVNWLFALPLMAALMWWQGVAASPQLWMLPLVLIPLLALALGLALIAAVAALPMGDVSQALPLLLTPLMFISAVVFPNASSESWQRIDALNPMVPWLAAIRHALYGGPAPEAGLLLAHAAGACAILLLAWRLFFLVMPRVAEHA